MYLYTYVPIYLYTYIPTYLYTYKPPDQTMNYVYFPTDMITMIRSEPIGFFIESSDVTSATHLVKGARVFPQAFGFVLFSDPLVDVGICTASPNATQHGWATMNINKSQTWNIKVFFRRVVYTYIHLYTYIAIYLYTYTPIYLYTYNYTYMPI